MRMLGVSLVIVLLDQITKQVMDGWLGLCQPYACERQHILPFFQLVVLYNEGAAFSFLADAGGWQRWVLSGVSLTVSIGICIWLLRLTSEQRILRWSLALILGGALGNLIDRALFGHVIDFLVLYYDPYYFPAFNVADAAISLGACGLLLDMFLTKETKS
ncbi:MAG: signal peptidase II [Gammaproteobacteria bacterium]|nr:signal peptidase II [Gammaproteobacteria bacterium]